MHYHLALALMLLAQPAAQAVKPAVLESGRYIVFSEGKPIGQEDFSHVREGGRDVWTGTSTVRASGYTLNQKPRLVLNAKGLPLTFDLTFNSRGTDEFLTYTFTESMYRVTRRSGGKDLTEDHPLPSNPVVLSNNIIHHYLVLARRYDWKSGGRQEFTAIPRAAVSLEPRGPEVFQSGETAVTLRRLFLSIGGVLGANLWFNPGGELVKIDIPQQRAEIFLEGFEQLKPGTVHVPPPSVSALEVTYPSGDHAIAGTLTLPVERPGRVPAVLLVSDSGPQDRNGDTEGIGGYKAGLLRTIAEQASAAGIAALRYDERGVGKSGGDFVRTDMTALEEDVRAGIAYLRTRPEIDPERLAIVGHGEGAILAVRAGARDGAVKAVVCLAAAARDGRSLLSWQLEQALARSGADALERKTASDQQEAFIRSVQSARNDVDEIDGRTTNIAWFRQFLALAPLQDFKALRCPVLILHGDRDTQIPAEDAAALGKWLSESNHPDYEVRRFASLGHFFSESSGDGLAELADTRKSMALEARHALIDFLRRKL